MTAKQETITIEMIPVDQIAVINPRIRNKKTFLQIVDSISKVGLKKPITVSRNENRDDEPTYKLVCGQGRLEAFISLGEHEIPARIVDVTEEDSLVMSLVENLARRRHRPLELLQDIGELRKRGYSDEDIATKTGLSYVYVHSIRHLLDEGEERLLAAVETGQIPISVAIDIAEADEEGVQEALAQAYQEGLLRGKKLLMAKRLVEQRQRHGKAVRLGRPEAVRSRMSSGALVRAYEQEADRQRLMIKKAEVTQNRLLFVVEAMRQLLGDENFVNLMRAEDLATMPRPLADLIAARDTR
jgi:ParB family chromosome partitioning protein